ncbi:PQQ-binding-like beta-propeller repeat protein [Streptomyces sp. NPDC051956]|uniref:outer membrane protein assembly factor BamB family protein n=1 Tax=Streptomyces sp. NPDC051956 TaxID=3365677 RepID=UPI0037CE1801
MTLPPTGLDATRDGDVPHIAGYSVLAPLWESATVIEYVARDHDDGATVTLVVPRPRLAASSALRRRLRVEAELAVRAAGPWTARVRQVTDSFLVTAYRPALPLDAAVARHGPLPEHALCVLGAALAETLARVHAIAPVHQGLAPHTVRLATDGPLLTGFGPVAAATAVSTSAPEPRLTLGYLTPEQVARHTPGPASDIFVLGLLLVYAATGAGPFPEAAPDVLATADAELSGVPERLRPVLARCLSKDPAARPTPQALAAELAPRGIATLLAAGWLPGPLMAELSQQASTVLALETTGHNDSPAQPGHTATVAAPPDHAQGGGPGGPKPPAADARRPTRRTLLAAGAGLVVGTAAGWGVSRALGPERSSAASSAATGGRVRRVARTAPAALWHYKAPDDGYPALVWRDDLLVLPGGPTICLDLKTGKTRWNKEFSCTSTPVTVHDDLLLAPTFRGLVTFSAKTGSVRGTDTRYGDFVADGFLGRYGRQVWFSDSKINDATYLICYDAVEGDEVWRTRLPKDTPTIADLTTTKESVHARVTPSPGEEEKGRAVFLSFDRRTGKLRRRRSFGALKAKDGRSWLSADGVLYTEDRRLRAYDLESGSELWTEPSDGGGGAVMTPRAVKRVGSSLYVVDSVRTVFALDTRHGTIRWQSRPADQVILVDDLRVSVDTGDSDRPVYRLDAMNVTAHSPRDGTVEWVFEGVGEPYPVENGGPWQVVSGTDTAVFSRASGKHYFALPIG